MAFAIPEILYDAQTVAQMLGVHVVTLARWRAQKTNLYAHLKVGRSIRYRAADVEAYKTAIYTPDVTNAVEFRRVG